MSLLPTEEIPMPELCPNALDGVAFSGKLMAIVDKKNAQKREDSKQTVFVYELKHKFVLLGTFDVTRCQKQNLYVCGNMIVFLSNFDEVVVEIVDGNLFPLWQLSRDGKNYHPRDFVTSPNNEIFLFIENKKESTIFEFYKPKDRTKWNVTFDSYLNQVIFVDKDHLLITDRDDEECPLFIYNIVDQSRIDLKKKFGLTFDGAKLKTWKKKKQFFLVTLYIEEEEKNVIWNHKIKNFQELPQDISRIYGCQYSKKGDLLLIKSSKKIYVLNTNNWSINFVKQISSFIDWSPALYNNNVIFRDFSSEEVRFYDMKTNNTVSCCIPPEGDVGYFWFDGPIFRVKKTTNNNREIFVPYVNPSPHFKRLSLWLPLQRFLQKYALALSKNRNLSRETIVVIMNKILHSQNISNIFFQNEKQEWVSICKKALVEKN